MIENIHSHEGEEKGSNEQVVRFRPPKNIKQIGENTSQRKIYVEDYVFTYIKELVKKEYAGCRIIVLLGSFYKTQDMRITMINGAVEAEEIHFDAENVFSNDAWTNVYENIKKYYSDVEIVGWCIGGPGFILDNMDKLKKIHLDNFAGIDKTLLKYDSIEGEESFYIYEHGGLVQQNGYYIYYEKNDDMQNYIFDHGSDITNVPKEIEETTMKEYKEEVKEQKARENNLNLTHLVYAAASLFVVILIIAFSALIHNNSEIKDLERTVNELSSMMVANRKQSPVEDEAVDVSTKQGGTLNIETIPGNIASKNDETVIGDRAEKINQKDDDAPKENNSEKKDNSSEKDIEDGNEEHLNGEDKKNENETSSKGEDVKGEDDTTGKEDSQNSNQGEENNDGTNTADGEDEVNKEARVNYYEVQKGDTLVGISFKLYNTGDYVTKIMKLNQIEDMDKIYYGQKLIVP